MGKREIFLQGTEFRKLSVQNTVFELELNEHIFPPSENGSFYAESIRINSGETVIDIGTGSGILAIFAAIQKGIVYATDIDSNAIKTALKNALLNKVHIEFSQGELFANFNKKFDVIIANLPNEIVYKPYLDMVGRERANIFDGGKSGNEHILNLLKAAPEYMHKKSRLYLPVHTLTDYNETLRYVLTNYQAKLVAVGQLRTKQFVEDNLDYYLKLNEEGIIQIFLQNGKWYSNGYIYELSL